MKEFLDSFFHKKNFWKRLFLVIAAVILIGLAISFLLLIDLGTDPCTMLNNAVSQKLGISIGNWQAFMNTVLLIIVVLFGARNLGFGTLANMFLVGYSIDFFNWLWQKVLPLELFQFMWVRLIVLVPALLLFIFAAALYMSVDLGTAPYDAIPFVISMRLPNTPFRTVRMVFDFSVIVIAFFLGGTFGIVTILMAFTIGPAVGWLSHYLETHTSLLQ